MAKKKSVSLKKMGDDLEGQVVLVDSEDEDGEPINRRAEVLEVKKRGPIVEFLTDPDIDLDYKEVGDGYLVPWKDLMGLEEDYEEDDEEDEDEDYEDGDGDGIVEAVLERVEDVPGVGWVRGALAVVRLDTRNGLTIRFPKEPVLDVLETLGAGAKALSLESKRAHKWAKGLAKRVEEGKPPKPDKKFEEARASLKKSLKDVKALKESERKLRAENKKLLRDAEVHQEAADKAEKDMQSLADELEHANNENEDARSEAKTLAKEVKALNKESGRLRGENTALKKKLEKG